MAVINDFSRLFQHVNMVRAERKNGDVGHEVAVIAMSFDRMQYACRVIHHAIRIDNHRELLLFELTSDAFCEARTHEKHSCSGLNLP